MSLTVPGLVLASQLIGFLILLDFSARLWISKDRWKLLRQIYTLADIVVIMSLVLDPFLTGNLAFLEDSACPALDPLIPSAQGLATRQQLFSHP